MFYREHPWFLFFILGGDGGATLRRRAGVLRDYLAQNFHHGVGSDSTEYRAWIRT